MVIGSRAPDVSGYDCSQILVLARLVRSIRDPPAVRSKRRIPLVGVRSTENLGLATIYGHGSDITGRPSRFTVEREDPPVR